MMGTTSSHERDLEIPADLAALREAREWAANVAEEFGLSDDDCFQVKLAMSEAVTNAIIHGSAEDGDLVRIVAERTAEELRFEVTDSGNEGADPATRLAEGGRGLELVAMVMDEVELTRGADGGHLRFAKKLHAVA